MRETILLFHFTDKDRRNKLMRALLPLRMKVKEILPEDYGKQMGYLAGLKEFTTQEEKDFVKQLQTEGQPHMEDISAQNPSQEFPGEMMVMAGLGGGRIDQVLRAVRKSGISVPYKAVLTAANQTWNAWELFAEIKKEHETMSGKDML